MGAAALVAGCGSRTSDEDLLSYTLNRGGENVTTGGSGVGGTTGGTDGIPGFPSGGGPAGGTSTGGWSTGGVSAGGGAVGGAFTGGAGGDSSGGHSDGAVLDPVASVVARLAEGDDGPALATWVGERGVTLSGGQRQRLSLARAFLTKPKILLLDEPTASVEPESESLIHDSILKRTREGAGTTVLVTHRIDLLRQAPRILFLDEGKLTGDGTHEELVASCPGYVHAYHRWEVEEAVVGR